MAQTTKVDGRRRESASGFHFINLYQCCPRKFFLRYGLGWRVKITPEPLVAGGAFHEGKATFYLTGNEKKAIREGLGYAELAKGELDSKETYERILFRTENLLHYWIEQIGKQDLIQYKPVMVEKELVVPVGDTGFKMTMRPDAVLEDRYNKQQYVMETKTSGFSHRVTAEAVYYGDQATAYLWGLRKVTKLKPYAVLPDIAYWRKEDRNVQNIKFIRSDLVFRDEYQTQLFENSMKQLFQEVTQKMVAVKKGYNPDVLFPRNSYYCLSYSHPCEYSMICQKDCKGMKRVPSGFAKDKQRNQLGKQVEDIISIQG